MTVGRPDALRSSPLLGAGGVCLARSWPGPELLVGLRREAGEAFRVATESRVDASDREEHRGGCPRRRFLSAPGGPLQQGLFGDRYLQRYLSDLVGAPVEPSGMAGTYSYYAREGDFLTIHRDVVNCDVAVITCLEDDGARGSSGASCLWLGWRRDEPLTSLRANPGPGGELLRLEPGDTLVILGGIVPHAVLPVVAGQRRVVSLLCYEVAAGA